MAAMTGYMDSSPPICMAVDASSPGAMKSRKGTPPTGCLTNEPRPSPIAPRYSTWYKKLVVIHPRHVRLYWCIQYRIDRTHGGVLRWRRAPPGLRGASGLVVTVIVGVRCQST